MTGRLAPNHSDHNFALPHLFIVLNIIHQSLLQKARMEKIAHDLPLTKKIFQQNYLISIILLLSAVILCLLLSVYLTQKNMRSDVLYKTDTLASNIADSMLANDMRGMQNMVLNATNTPDLLSVNVYDQSGKAILAWAADGHLIDTTHLALSPLVRRSQIELQRQQLSAIAPIRNGTAIHGKLILQTSTWPLYRHALQLLVYGGLLAGILATVAAHLLTQRQLLSMAPVFALSAIAEKVATLGDYSLRAPTDSQHELGNLTMHFNLMLARMEAWETDMHSEARERRETESRLSILDNHDSLTKLPNRHFFHRYITDCVEEATNSHKMMTLMFIDIDHFKKLSDSFGYDAGDLVLTIMANRLCEVLRSTDMLCRVGADEFAAILPEVDDLQTVRLLAERLVQAIHEPINVRGKQLVVTASIGIACCPLHARDQRLFLENADSALKNAKTEGRNTWRLYTSSPSDSQPVSE